MKIAVIGGVTSTALLVQRLHQYPDFITQVWGYAPEDNSLVSGWVDLAELSIRIGCVHHSFVKVTECFDSVKNFAPDVIFCVGLSQLIPQDFLNIPRYGCIGFHPTQLPRGRGRAPIAWIVLDKVPAAATFFAMRKGVDNGPILAQQPFSVDDTDDAARVEEKLLRAAGQALDVLLPQLEKSWVTGTEQDHSQANWYGRRAPEDGVIDWDSSAPDIARLVRASTRPHPGSFTYAEDIVVTVWQAIVHTHPERGVVGRILSVGTDGSFVVQCGRGLLKIQKWNTTSNWQPKVGQRLGYYVEAEIHQLRDQVRVLNKRVAELEKLVREGIVVAGKATMGAFTGSKAR